MWYKCFLQTISDPNNNAVCTVITDNLCNKMELPGTGGLQTNDDSDLDGLFHYATEHMKTLVGTLDSEDLLFFYGRFKQSTIGPCNVDKPSFFDFTGKEKWNAWKNMGDMTKVI